MIIILLFEVVSLPRFYTQYGAVRHKLFDDVTHVDEITESTEGFYSKIGRYF